MRTLFRTILWIATFLVLAASACSPTLPAQTVTPLPEPATPNVAQTATAQRMTVIAGFSPTASTTPSVTPTAYPTITPFPSQTPAQSATPNPQPTTEGGTEAGQATETPAVTDAPATEPFACQVVSKSPTDWTVMKQGNPFDGSWQIKNTGLNTWNVGKVVLMYLSGNKFQKNKDRTIYNLASDVFPKGSTTLAVDMIAPSRPDKYTSTWGLVYLNPKKIFCDLTIRITTPPQ